MLELYFIFYRIPKTMTRLARERNRSAVRWTILAIASWIGAEIIVGIALGLIHGVGIVLWGWPRESQGLNLLAYVIALIAALLSVTILTRILTNLPVDGILPQPPPPPTFDEPQRTNIT